MMLITANGKNVSQKTAILINKIGDEINPKATFKQIIQDIADLDAVDKNLALDVVCNKIKTAISELSDLSSMADFYFGSIGKTLTENWLIMPDAKDKLITRRFQQLEKNLKRKVYSLIVVEVGILSDEAIKHGDFCAYDRYVFTRDYTSKFDRKVYGNEKKFQAAIEALLRFYGLKIHRTNNYDGLWRVIDSLRAINKARVLFVTPPKTHDNHDSLFSRNQLIFVHVFDKFIEDLFCEKFNILHRAEELRCTSTIQLIDIFYKYPIFDHRTEEISKRCHQILKIM